MVENGWMLYPTRNRIPLNQKYSSIDDVLIFVTGFQYYVTEIAPLVFEIGTG